MRPCNERLDECAAENKSMKGRAECIGRANGLGGRRLKDFTGYVKFRFPEHIQSRGGMNYISEWAERFQDGKEWERSDLDGRRILKRLNPSKYGRK